MFFQLVVLHTQKKSQEYMSEGSQLNLLIESAMHPNRGLPQKITDVLPLNDNLVLNCFMAPIYLNCDVSHWFCKITRFFATEPAFKLKNGRIKPLNV